jgi:protein-disulfide isomerase
VVTGRAVSISEPGRSIPVLKPSATPEKDPDVVVGVPAEPNIRHCFVTEDQSYAALPDSLVLDAQ